ncbi:TraY domain-containing protein (plasmid) [Edwardsiella tarda]|nr:TraY domain-containing protein [Edwardsiella tarda]UCQ29555.1 TraY domain-containing protein [Edwardsiella tarda]
MLVESAKAAGRSKSTEAMLRLTQHLQTVPALKESYWDILLRDN